MRNLNKITFFSFIKKNNFFVGNHKLFEFNISVFMIRWKEISQYLF